MRFGKPALDRSVGVVLLVAAAPALAAVGTAVALRLGRPVLLGQDRVGRDGRVFRMYKFRTMLPDRRSGTDRRALLRSESSGRARAKSDRRVTHKSERDPRHTPLGRLLRRASLDELPQLWNVVRGDMSLVGPRPELASVVESDGLADHPRHLVRPGITGPWQLSAARNERLSKNLHLDEGYLSTISFRSDLALLVRTLRVPFRKAGT